MSKKKTVLIVDDDRDLVDILAKRCESIGLKVQKAHNLISAVVLMDKAFPDLLCVDVNFPAGNGLTFLDALRLDAGAARIPVIVLTGRQDPSTISRCQDLCAYYVRKSTNAWRAIEPIIYELIDHEPPGAVRRTV